MWPVISATTSITANVSRYWKSRDGEREARRHEEEIEARDADERREHRGTASELHRHEHDGEQEQHHDVREVEVRRAAAPRRAVVATHARNA